MLAMTVISGHFKLGEVVSFVSCRINRVAFTLYHLDWVCEVNLFYQQKFQYKLFQAPY